MALFTLSMTSLFIRHIKSFAM